MEELCSDWICIGLNRKIALDHNGALNGLLGWLLGYCDHCALSQLAKLWNMSCMQQEVNIDELHILTQNLANSRSGWCCGHFKYVDGDQVCGSESVAQFGQHWLANPLHFCYAAISWRMRSMCHKPAQFVGNGQLFNLFFGSGWTAHWLLKYGRFKLGV